MLILDKQSLTIQNYKILLTTLDKHCNSFKISINDHHNHYEQIIALYDIIPLKTLLKNGKQLQDINKLTIIFLKLMISQQIKNGSIRIEKLKGMTFSKVVKNVQKIREFIIEKQQKEGEVKALAFVLKDDLILTIPRVIESRFVEKEEEKGRGKQEEKQRQLKSIFYDEIKELRLK